MDGKLIPTTYLTTGDSRQSTFENAIAIAKLQETMKTVDYRLNTLENKFNKLEDTFNERFDKIDQDAEIRRKEMAASQEKLHQEIKENQNKMEEYLKTILEQTKRTNGRVNSLEEYKNNVLLQDHEAIEKMRKITWQALGICALIVTVMSIFGAEFIHLLFK